MAPSQAEKGRMQQDGVGAAVTDPRRSAIDGVVVEDFVSNTTVLQHTKMVSNGNTHLFKWVRVPVENEYACGIMFHRLSAPSRHSSPMIFLYSADCFSQLNSDRA